jgi:hypothetical protein
MNIPVRHFGPIHTRDSLPTADALDDILSDLEKLGMLDAGDLGRIKAMRLKYSNGTGRTNKLGITSSSTDDVQAEFAHNAEVARGYKSFWDAIAARAERGA